MDITDFKCFTEANLLLDCDTCGANAAVRCPVCGHPVLFTAIRNKKGSSPARAAICPGCSNQFYIKVAEAEKEIVVYQKVADKL